MPKFGKKSKANLKGVNKDLVKVLNEAIKLHDFSVLEGLRGISKQKDLMASGFSMTMKSKHLDGDAVDIAPYPIEWEDELRFCYLAGLMIGISHMMGIKIRWGGDWDRDGVILSDQTFNDLPHFEVVDG